MAVLLVFNLQILFKLKNTNIDKSACVGATYAAGSWRREISYGYGTTTFQARGPTVSGIN